MTLLNFLRFRVQRSRFAAGGDSALYGVEGPGYYLRNAATNLNLALPLALMSPLTALLLLTRRTGGRLCLALRGLGYRMGIQAMTGNLSDCVCSCLCKSQAVHQERAAHARISMEQADRLLRGRACIQGQQPQGTLSD